MTPFQQRLTRVGVHWMTGLNIVAYRLSEGRAAARVGSAPLCLLTTTGRRSGRARTVVLLCLPDGVDLVVVASWGGMSADPAWYHNLRARPDAVVRLGSVVRPVRARDAGQGERARLWPRLDAVYPHFEAYRARTTRRIPVVILSPGEPDQQPSG
jgi:deazaflavin-dependent oxidoreductase (nitroreductase family)